MEYGSKRKSRDYSSLPFAKRKNEVRSEASLLWDVIYSIFSFLLDEDPKKIYELSLLCKCSLEWVRTSVKARVVRLELFFSYRESKYRAFMACFSSFYQRGLFSGLTKNARSDDSTNDEGETTIKILGKGDGVFSISYGMGKEELINRRRYMIYAKEILKDWDGFFCPSFIWEGHMQKWWQDVPATDIVWSIVKFKPYEVEKKCGASAKEGTVEFECEGHESFLDEWFSEVVQNENLKKQMHDILDELSEALELF